MVLALAACQSPEPEAAPTAAEEQAPATEEEEAPPAEEEAPADEETPDEEAPVEEAPAGEASELRLAVLLPGVITDADYNTLGYVAATEVQSTLGIDMAYSENVAVPDVDRIMREYIDGGYNVIFTHGGQFISQTRDLASEFPDVVFIAESDAPEEDPPPNLWVIDRNFHIGYYAIGALAAKQTETGKIAYLGGLTLPFSYSEVHAVEQAIDDLGADVELQAVWSGDFNDPSAARELTDAMIADDVDVIMGSLNLGMFGVFEGVRASDSPVWVTAKYSDKSTFAPDHYLTSLVYDYAGPLEDILTRISEGESGGYYPLGFDTGVGLQFPLANVSDEVNAEMEALTASLANGEIEVVKNTEPIE